MKKMHVFKPVYTYPPKLHSSSMSFHNGMTKAPSLLIRNYKSFGFISNPNFFGFCSHTSNVVESDSLHVSNCLCRPKNPPLNSIPPISTATSKKTVVKLITFKILD
ncbi:hypothetical protein Ddye_028738 [Dipteronia dyeriana]|uniref:Uncharacterized protein n=1 Tax=Dipteronia dyeriana TaxID=168575 RepID=A0AAD9WJY5_9ROSI|nr:hypothetical protein Ddye_028738 [Dipteronia dyeriana]